MDNGQMNAVVYTQYGSPDFLQYKEINKPTPKAGEVLVKVQAASVNYGDAVLVRGKPYLARLWSGLRAPKHQILGTDIAGSVEAVGSGVDNLQPGDEVFADVGGYGFGAYAEYRCIPEEALTPKPANLSFEQTAAVPQAAVVALQGLRDVGKIKSGDKVLINGASGGIGVFAVQIAKSFGAEVTGVCSSKNLELVLSIGADHVIDYTQEEFTQNGQRYDLIFDIVANRPISEYLRALNPKGRYVACAFNPSTIFLGSIISKATGKQVHSLSHKPKPEDLATMKELLEAGKVMPVIDRCYPLREVADAVRYIEKGHPTGKIVITMDKES